MNKSIKLRKLTPDQAQFCRDNYGETIKGIYHTYKVLAEKYKVDITVIFRICSGIGYKVEAVV